MKAPRVRALTLALLAEHVLKMKKTVGPSNKRPAAPAYKRRTDIKTTSA